ncbi:NAD-dependent epimerase/dehydratase [Macleaya cordata]|uniref:NAD-dependent epimerase/dehydratase n=1 Tax=Macleaya cordata TaxID=56857 RepID=A0A200PZP4_MACCD|nr:NAD-dependent epimerase/dehydratase [Macleaya cordata]
MATSEEKKKKEKVVCVTGANGFIGSWLVRTLLHKGYTVHATIFPGSDASHLTTTNPSGGCGGGLVVVFQADILDQESISRAIEGCEGVFHVASPCTLEDPKDPQLELVLPAVQGTFNVLEASRNFNVRRVVLTSSISALVPNPSWSNTIPFDETSWTDLDYCKSRQKWYPVSKTLAEKAAWEYAEKHGLDLVAIHPSTCLGPLLQPSLNASCAVLQQLLQGSEDTQEYHWLGAVHVRDVANAQVLLFETPSASGRYLCTNGIYQFMDFAQVVSKLCPEFPVHRFVEDTQPGLVGCKNAAKRLLDLGLVFTPIEDAIQDTVESLKAKGFL